MLELTRDLTRVRHQCDDIRNRKTNIKSVPYLRRWYGRRYSFGTLTVHLDMTEKQETNPRGFGLVSFCAFGHLFFCKIICRLII